MSDLIRHEFIVILLSYFLGAIPFSHLIARWRAGINIREHGEGNAGARNVYHVVGPLWGTLVAVLDVGKGLAAYLIASRMALDPTTVLVAGFAAPLGHGFSPFLRFRGGKGVATTVGFLLGLQPWPTLAGALLYGLAYFLLHDFNRAIVVGVVGVIFLPLLFGDSPRQVAYTLFLFLMLAVIKIIDHAHERAVWARDPWRSGSPGFHPEEPEVQPETRDMRPGV